MSKLTRWNLRDVAETEDESPLYDGMETAKNGEWVQYDDVKSIRDELARVEKELGQVKLVYTPELRTIQTAQVQQLQADLATMTKDRDRWKQNFDHQYQVTLAEIDERDEWRDKFEKCSEHLATVTKEQDYLKQVHASIEQAISAEFAKKTYTNEDREHKDILDNMGVFLDHHQQLEQHLAACREALAHILREAPDAFGKIKREYKAVQPDALPDECWAEVEALEVAIEEAEDALKEN